MTTGTSTEPIEASYVLRATPSYLSESHLNGYDQRRTIS